MKNAYIRLLFLGTVIVVLAISLLTYRNLSNYIEEVRMVRHSNKVLIAVQTVLSSIKDAEIGHRGYQLTRDSNFLQPYLRSVRDLPTQIRRLDSLLSYNDRQSKKADSLNILINNQFMIIGQILSNAKRSSLYMDQFEAGLLLRGKQNMDKIRKAVDRITAAEERTISDRTSNETRYRNTAPIALLAYTLIALMAMTLLFVRVLQALKNQRKQQLLIEERGLLLKEAESLANMGSWRWHEKTDHLIWSDGLYRIWGCAPHSFKPFWSSFYKNVYREDLERVQEFIENTKAKKIDSELSYRIEVAGHLRHIVLVAHLREDPEKQAVDILGTVIDVTAQKKAERDILLAERLSMTGKIARTIAHEVRNPLTSLNLALEQLKDGSSWDSESVKTYTDIIERNANRIEQLIDEMLNSSKPKELNLELTAISEVLDETLALANDRMNLNEIKLEVSYASDLPRILLDKEKMKIAFLNIIINAVEAMQPGKGVLRINTNLRNGFVIVSFIDNGKGIEPEEIEKLFDPFYTGKPGGIGLGLTSTKSILSSHSATIEVNSVLKEGTIFSTFFKLAAS